MFEVAVSLPFCDVFSHTGGFSFRESIISSELLQESCIFYSLE